MAVFCSSSSRFRFVVALGFTAGLLFAPAVLAADTTTTTRSTEWGSLSNSFAWFYSDSNPSAVDAASPEYLSTDRGDKDSFTSTSTKKDYYNSDDDQQGGSSSIHNDKQNKKKQEEEEEASLRLSRMITSCLAKSSVVEDIVHDLIEHTCQTKPWIAANLAEDLMSYDVLLERLKSLVTKIADQTSSVLSTATTATAPAAAAAVGGGEKEKKDHRVDDRDEDAAVLERLGLAIRAGHEENDTVPDTTTTTHFDDDVLLLLPPPRTWSWFGGSIQIQVDWGRFQHAIGRGKKGFFCSHHAWMNTIRRWLLHQMRDQVQRLDELKHDAIQFWSDKVQQCQECLYDDYSSDKTVIFLSSRVPGIVAVVLILVLYCWRVWHTLFVKRQNSNAQDDMTAVHFDDDQDSSTDPQDVTLVPDGEEPTDQGHTSANDTTISATVEANEPVPLASPQVTAVVAAAACSNDTERLATSTGTRNGEDEDEKPAGTTYVSLSPPGTPKEPPAGPLLLLVAPVSPEENSGSGMANAFSETPARSSRPLVVPDPQDGRSGEDDHDDDDKNYKTFLTPLRGWLNFTMPRKENREAVEPAPKTTLPPAPSMEDTPTTRPSEASALASIWNNIRANATSAAGTLFAGKKNNKGYDDDDIKSDQHSSRKRTLACGDGGNNDVDDNNKSDQPPRIRSVMPNETVNKKPRLTSTTAEEELEGSRPPLFDLNTNVQQASSGDGCSGDSNADKGVTKTPKPNSTSATPSQASSKPSQDSSKPSPGPSSTGATDTGAATSSNGTDDMEVDLPDNGNDPVVIPAIEFHGMRPGQKVFLCPYEKCNHWEPIPPEYECYNKLVTRPGQNDLLLIVDDSIPQDFRKSNFKAFQDMRKHIVWHYTKDFCLSDTEATIYLPIYLPRFFQNP